MATVGDINARAQDNFEQARAHEHYRIEFLKIIISVLGIMVALLSIEQSIVDHKTVAIGASLFGIFGALVSAKHYERNRFHNKYAHFLISQTEQGKANVFNLSSGFDDFKKKGEWEHSQLRHVRLNWLWTGFPLVVVIVVIVIS